MEKVSAWELIKMGALPSLSGRDSIDRSVERKGYNKVNDVLITQTTDGVDLNQIYAEFQAAVALQNAERTAVVDFLTFSVQNAQEQVGQLTSASFERATEFGEPQGMRQAPSWFWMGYDFHWYDLAARFTWQYLSEASSADLEGINQMALDADNRLVFGKVMDALYNPANRIATINGMQTNVYALYNGDGTVPPPYKSNTFSGTDTHYLTSGAATVDSQDLDTLVEKLRAKGYGPENGVQHLIAVNSREGKVIRTFRVATGSTYDFIPSIGSPLDLILQPGQQISGVQPGSSYQGLPVIGKYGDALIIEDDLFPAGYVAIIGSGGRANLNNPVGIREHANTSLRGLRLVQGRSDKYPLMDSFYQRGLGTGIRQRGGAAILQITASGTYQKPSQYGY